MEEKFLIAAKYQRELIRLLKTDTRNTMYSFALRSTPMFRRFIEQKPDLKIQQVIRDSKFGWILDTFPLLVVERYFNETHSVHLDFNVLMPEILDNLLKDNANHKALEMSKTIVCPFEEIFHFKYNLNEITVDDGLASWQELIGPILWLLLHKLATNITDLFLDFLEYLHLFIGCLNCSEHYFKVGRQFFLHGKFTCSDSIRLQLFLIRLHNYVSKHFENIKAPDQTDDIVPSIVEKKYLEFYNF